MHPASSLIVFTTLSGAGFGLMFLLGLGFGPDDILFGFVGCGLAAMLAGIGLVASLWHLGNPQRAWRALSQWRSSWLSREGVLAIATLGVFGLYALAWIAGYGRVPWLGWAAALFAGATVYATSMIYGTIKAVPHWSKTPTPVLFGGYALSGGAMALAALAAPFGEPSRESIVLTAALLILAAALAIWWTLRAQRISLDADGSTPETAIGLPHLGRARLLEAPHSSPNYLMKEMVFRVGRKHAEKLRRFAFAGAFVVPLLFLILAATLPFASLLLIALPIHLAGVAASRWLFFAEARHVVSLYYGYR